MNVEHVAIRRFVWPNGGNEIRSAHNLPLAADEFGEDGRFDRWQSDAMSATAQGTGVVDERLDTSRLVGPGDEALGGAGDEALGGAGDEALGGAGDEAVDAGAHVGPVGRDADPIFE